MSLALQMQRTKNEQAEVMRPNAEIACEFELTILMPCLNEAETLASCIRKANGIFGEKRNFRRGPDS